MMAWMRSMGAWLQGLRDRRRASRELREEFRFHLEMETRANLESGMSPREARRKARLAFGSGDWHAERVREERGGALVEDVLRDLRAGFRNLGKRPAFAVAAILTLSLGIGMTTTMFTLVDGLLLRPLPGSNTEGLVYVGLLSEDGEVEISPTPELLRLVRDNVSSFSRVEAYAVETSDLSLDGEIFREKGARVSVGFFSFLGIDPALGRGFVPADGRGSSTPVVLLSRRLWMDRFGGSRDALGRVLVIDGVAHEVVGVLPGDFRLDTIRDPLFWVPEGAAGALFADEVPVEGALARLRDGISLEAAGAELEAVIRNNPLEEVAGRNWVAQLRRPADLLDPKLRPALLLFQAGALLVLLIGCGNLANLLLAQGEARGRELALRASLGAGRGRLVRQLLAESAALGVVGCVGGVLLTVWALDLVPALLPPEYGFVALHGRVFVVAAAASLLSVLGVGLLPALRGSRRGLVEAIKGTPASPGGGSGRRVGPHLMVTVQVAMAVVLLVAGGLLLKSFRGLMTADVGFDYRDLLAIRLHLPEERYGDPEAQLAFYRELRDRVGTVSAPGLRGFTVASGLVENLGVAMGPVVPEGEDEQEGPPSFLVVWEVGPEYFDVVGVPLLSGRGFDGSEARDGEAVVIINRTLANRYFQGRDPMGRLLKAGRSQYRVVGVAGSVDLPGFAGSSIGGLQLFFPFTQRPGSEFTLLARVGGDRETAVQRLKEAVWAVDGSVPVQDVALIQDELSESLATERANALLMALFALTALALGAVGIYGVVAYSVNRRVREVGIRMAMGASSGEVVGKVMAGGMTRVVVGMIVGGAGALALGSTLSGLLVGVSPRDPGVFAVVFLVMGSVALLSTWLPARRAARIRPVEALRTE